MTGYTVTRAAKHAFAVLDPNGIEITRFTYESDARFYANRANAERDALAGIRRETAATQALVADLEADGLL